MNNPCATCSHKNESKLNNPICENCEKRFEYVDSMGHPNLPSQNLTPSRQVKDMKSNVKLVVKKCSACNEIKPLEDFPNSKKTKDGKDYLCRACKNERQKIYNQNYINKKANKKPTVRETVKQESDAEPVKQLPLKPAIITINFSDYPELLSEITRLAKIDFRTPEFEILAIIDRVLSVGKAEL